jgi:hypothetical protein
VVSGLFRLQQNGAENDELSRKNDLPWFFGPPLT